MRRINTNKILFVFLFLITIVLSIFLSGVFNNSQYETINALEIGSTTVPTEGYISMSQYVTSSVGTMELSGPAQESLQTVDKLFDNDLETKYCHLAEANNPNIVTVTYSSAFVLRAYGIATANDASEHPDRNYIKWTIEGSTDNTNYYTITSCINEDNSVLPADNEVYKYFYCANSKAYQYYKITLYNSCLNDEDDGQISEFELFAGNELKCVNNYNSSSATINSSNANCLFDGDVSTEYVISSSYDSTIIVEYTTPFLAKGYSFTSALSVETTNTINPTSWVISGSNDNENWTQITSVDTSVSGTLPLINSYSTYFDLSSNSNVYKYYKLYLNNSNTTTTLSEFSIYEYSSEYYSYEFDSYDGSDLTNDLISASSKYSTVSSNTDGVYEDQGVTNLFDCDTATKYCYSQSGDCVVTISYSSAFVAKAYSFTTANDVDKEDYYKRNFQSWSIYGSTDETEWTLLTYIDNNAYTLIPRTNYATQYFSIDNVNNTKYAYYKLVISNENECSQMSEFSLYMLDDTTNPTDVVITADRDLTYYYNDVTLSVTASSDSGSGFYKYSYKTAASDDWVDSFIIPLNSTTINAPETGTLNKTIYVRAYDIQGNYSETTKTLCFDTTDYTITYNNVTTDFTNSNPSTFNVETETFTLSNDIARYGFTFDGFYEDYQFNTGADSTIEKQTHENLVYYVKFTLDDPEATITETGATIYGTKYYMSVTPTQDNDDVTFYYQWQKTELNSDTFENITGETSYYYNYNPESVGTYKFKVVVTAMLDGYSSNVTSNTLSLSVSQKDLTITADDKSLTYGSAVPTYTVTFEGFVNDEDESNLGGELAFDCAYTTSSVVDTYSITPSGYTSTNYAISFVNGVLAVTGEESDTSIVVSETGSGTVSQSTIAGVPEGSFIIVNGKLRLKELMLLQLQQLILQNINMLLSDGK